VLPDEQQVGDRLGISIGLKAKRAPSDICPEATKRWRGNAEARSSASARSGRMTVNRSSSPCRSAGTAATLSRPTITTAERERTSIRRVRSMGNFGFRGT
jgi:hypothetical protein